MPLYEYKCANCGDIFEVMQKFSDAPLSTHAACGGAVERLISSPALQFKGSGWYITDYAKSNGGAKSDGQNGADASPARQQPAAADSSAKPPSPPAAPAK